MRSANEHGGAVTDVAGNEFVREFWLVNVHEGGVDGVAEIARGIDECAVEVPEDGLSHGHSVAPFARRPEMGWKGMCEVR